MTRSSAAVASLLAFVLAACGTGPGVSPTSTTATSTTASTTTSTATTTTVPVQESSARAEDPVVAGPPLRPLTLGESTTVTIAGDWIGVRAPRATLPPRIHARVGDMFVGIESAYQEGHGGLLVADEEGRTWVWTSTDGRSWTRTEAPELSGRWVMRVDEVGGAAFVLSLAVVCHEYRADDEIHETCPGGNDEAWMVSTDGLGWVRSDLPTRAERVMEVGEVLVARNAGTGGWLVSADGGLHFGPATERGGPAWQPDDVVPHIAFGRRLYAYVDRGLWVGVVEQDATIRWSEVVYELVDEPETSLGRIVALRALTDRLVLITTARASEALPAKIFVSGEGRRWHTVPYPVSDTQLFLGGSNKPFVKGTAWLLAHRSDFRDVKFGRAGRTGLEDQLVATEDAVTWYELQRPPWEIPDDAVVCELCIEELAAATWISVAGDTIFVVRSSEDEREIMMEASLLSE